MTLTDALVTQVTYFKKYRVAEHKKKQTIEKLEKEGANKMDAGGVLGSAVGR